MNIVKRLFYTPLFWGHWLCGRVTRAGGKRPEQPCSWGDGALGSSPKWLETTAPGVDIEVIGEERAAPRVWFYQRHCQGAVSQEARPGGPNPMQPSLLKVSAPLSPGSPAKVSTWWLLLA